MRALREMDGVAMRTSNPTLTKSPNPIPTPTRLNPTPTRTPSPKPKPSPNPTPTQVTVLAHCALGGVELVVVATEPRRADVIAASGRVDVGELEHPPLS